MNKSCVYRPLCCIRQWDCLFGNRVSSCVIYFNFIWRFPFPLLVQGKTPSKREGGDHELLDGNVHLCRCTSPKVQCLES